MVDFANRRLLGSAPPARFEVDLRDCEVTGAIPKDLDGALYRMHLDWLYPPANSDDTILAADGYISMFRVKNGRADYKGRYVQTLRYLSRWKPAGSSTATTAIPTPTIPSVRDIANPGSRTTANTTPVDSRRQALRDEGRRSAVRDRSEHARHARPKRISTGAGRARRSPRTRRSIR